MFLQDGTKEVIRFIAAPQQFKTAEDAVQDLRTTVNNYTRNCGKGYVRYVSEDNPFVTIIIHGVND